MRRIITLTGPSGAGKSTAIDYILKSKSSYFQPECIPKFTTREKRKDDSKREVKYCTELPESCDLVYQQYDVRYGLAIEDIVSKLQEGRSPIIVLNDVRTISEVKRIFGDIVDSLFVYRTEPKIEYFRELAHKRGVFDEIKIERRFRKAQAIYRIYIENIYLFNRVVINSFGRRELKSQIQRIVKSYRIPTSKYFKGEK